MEKKKYIKPEVTKIDLDYSISLQMQSQPGDPPPRTMSSPDQQQDPFASPFGDGTFD